MLSFSSLVLAFIHAIYSFILAFSSRVNTATKKSPLALDAPRRRIPSHLAILFVTDEEVDITAATAAFIQSVEGAVEWCRMAGIEDLAVYDRQGILVKSAQDIIERVRKYEDPTSDSSSDIEYPLTPPMSRPLSPEQDGQPSVVTINLTDPSEQRAPTYKSVLTRRRPPRKDVSLKPLTLHLVSQESSKAEIASCANSLVQFCRRQYGKKTKEGANNFHLTVETLDSLLQGKLGLSPPDMMILHPIVPSKYNQTPIEFHGFPPWQIRLTEIYHNRNSSWSSWRHETRAPSVSPLGELDFRAALDQFAEAEMRLGK